MRKQVVHKIIQLWPFGLFILGVVAILSPYLDGASEVCCPYLSYNYLATIYFFMPIFLPICVIFYLIASVFVLVRKPTKKHFLQILTPFLTLIIVWGTLNMSGLTRIDSFPVGGRLRLWLVDNPQSIRTTATELLSSTTEDEILHEDLPNKLQSLGITHIEIDKGTNIINAHFSTPGGFATKGDFGYLFQENESLLPVNHYSFENTRGYRLWKLQDGIYFYQKW